MASNALITKIARKKLVMARAGAITLPPITGMAFGDGGADADGTAIAPEEGQAALTNELIRKEISGYEILEDAVATCRYTATLTEGECVGKDISELGLYDAEGDLVCIKTFSPKGKDADLEMTFTLDDIF